MGTQRSFFSYKAEIKGVFNRLCCFYGNLWLHDNTCSPMNEDLFDTVNAASTDKK